MKKVMSFLEGSTSVCGGANVSCADDDKKTDGKKKGKKKATDNHVR